MIKIVLIYSLESEQEVLHKSKQWPNICSWLKAQITYFQNEEVTCRPMSLSWGCKWVVRLGLLLRFKRTKREKASGWEVLLGFLVLPLSFKSDQTRSVTIKKVLIWWKLVSSFHSMNKTAKWPSTLVVGSYQVQKCNQYLVVSKVEGHFLILFIGQKKLISCGRLFQIELVIWNPLQTKLCCNGSLVSKVPNPN
jgi:hypothetical protein